MDDNETRPEYSRLDPVPARQAEQAGIAGRTVATTAAW